jgi:hypothetical protein
MVTAIYSKGVKMPFVTFVIVALMTDDFGLAVIAGVLHLILGETSK